MATQAAGRTVWGDVVGAWMGHVQGVAWDLNGTLSLLRRRWALLGSVTLGVVALAVLMLLLTPPEFSASTQLQINTRTENVTTNMQDVVGGMSTDDAAIRTEVDVLKSRKLALRVIDELNLLEHPDFAGSPGLLGGVMGVVGYFWNPTAPSEADMADALSRKQTRAINAFLKRLDVAMLPRSYTINITFTSHDPKLAAQVANAMAEGYLTSQLEDKFEATKRANGWMNTRIKDMQRAVQAAEMAVTRFREANNLTTARGVTLNEQQLSELNTQLILARTQLAENQARANTGRGSNATSEVLNNPLIQNLRMQETEVRRKMSDLAARYGERHPRMVTVRNELSNVIGKINEESGKIRSSLGNDVAMAQARVATLEQQLNSLQEKGKMSTGAQVQLGELERQAQAERTLYEEFLSRGKEIAQMDFPQSDARVIYPAETPLNPSKPNKPMVVGLAFMLGLGLALVLVMLLEAMDSGFRTVRQLEEAIKLNALGMLGELPHSNDEERAQRAYYVVNKPTGAYTESVRAIRTALSYTNPDKMPKVLLTTSTVPQEGKSLLSISVAQTAAAGGQKVLLIDADLRRPSVAKQLGLEPKLGMVDILTSKAKMKDVLVVLKQSGLHVLPAISDTKFAQELLGSQKMAELLTEARKTYDLIVIDSPPVMAVSDTITLSKLVDAVIFAVRWGTTPRPLVANALKHLRDCNVTLAGAVLTRVDLEKQQAYGYGDYGYYYGKYKDYYSD